MNDEINSVVNLLSYVLKDKNFVTSKYYKHEIQNKKTKCSSPYISHILLSYLIKNQIYKLKLNLRIKTLEF